MKKYILLIDSGNDALDAFANAMSTKEISPSYNCILVRNTDMAVRVLSRIIPDVIFVNLSSNISLKTCLSKIHQLQTFHDTPLYLFGDPTLHESSEMLDHVQPGIFIGNKFSAEFLAQLLQGDLVMKGALHVICSN